MQIAQLCPEELQLLRDTLLRHMVTLQEKEFLKDGADDGEKELNSLVETTLNTMVAYELLLESVVVAINQGYQGFKVEWLRSEDTRVSDTLKITENHDNDEDNWRSKEQQHVLKWDFEQLSLSIEWLFQYKQTLKRVLDDASRATIAAEDNRRNEAMESHFIDYFKAHSEPKTQTDTRPMPTKNKLLKETKKLTNTLIRDNHLLQSSILQSDLNMDELRQQTDSLQKMNDKYTQFEAVFDKTAKLVKVLDQASRQEKRNVYLSLGFLCLCISWVLWRRVFKMPVKLAIWLLFHFFKTILVTMGLVQKLPTSPVATNTTHLHTTMVQSTISSQSTTDAIQSAVSEIVDGILPRDEL